MILTEEEAKTKRCQESFPAADGLSPGGYTEAVAFTTSSGPYASQGTGYARQTAPSMCIGSACMAWRWRRENIYQAIDESDKKPKGHANYADFILMEGQGDYSTTHGYCGKAGRP